MPEQAKSHWAFTTPGSNELELLDILPAHIALLNKDGVIVKVNTSWRRRAREQDSEESTCEGANYLRICQEAAARGDSKATEAYHGLSSLLEGKRTEFQLEYPCHSPLQQRWFRLKAYRDSVSGGALVLHEDCTEAILDMEDLRRSEQVFRALAEIVPQMVWSARPDGTTAFLNQRMLHHLGISDGGGNLWLERVHPEERLKTVLTWEESCRTGQDFRSENRCQTAAASQYRWVLLQASAQKDAEGRILRWFGTCTDIDEQKRAQAELEQIARFPRENPSPVLRISDTGFLLFANEASAPLLAYWRTAPGRALPTDVLDAVLPALSEGRLAELEVKCDNSVYSLSFTPSAAGYANVYGRDLTIERRMAEDLRRQAAELEHRVERRTASLQQLTDELNGFVHTLAHDLRAPLRTQIGMIQVLLDDFGEKLGPDGRRYAERIAQAAQRQMALIRDLMAHVEVTRADLKLEAVRLEEVVNEALTDLAFDIQQKKAKVELSELAGLRVMASRSILRLVVMNLLSNAIKFVPKGTQPEVRVWIEPAPADDAPAVRLWVQDNGIGISPKDLHKVFGIFQRLNSARDYPGTGIGLAMVKKAVERMAGSVGVESEPAKGSRFWLELPTVRELELQRPKGAAV